MCPVLVTGVGDGFSRVDAASKTVTYHFVRLNGHMFSAENGSSTAVGSIGGPGDTGGNPYIPPPPSGGANPTDADMQAAYYAVSVAQDNIAIAEAQRAAAYDYLQQARYFNPIALQMKADAEQRVRNTEIRLDALIAKTNNDFAAIDTWIAERMESIRTNGKASIKEYVDWFNNASEAVKERLLSFFSPVTGKTGEMQEAFEDLFELHRGDALTAAQYDALGLTAADYDNLLLTAYSYDVEGIS